MSTNQITVRLDRVCKSFGDFIAVNDLSLSVRAGRIYGLLGPNGAGKSTLSNILTGLYRADDGELERLWVRTATASEEAALAFSREPELIAIFHAGGDRDRAVRRRLDVAHTATICSARVLVE